jgi:hypothetical protein
VNRAGKPPLSLNLEQKRTSEESYEHHFSKASERIQA